MIITFEAIMSISRILTETTGGKTNKHIKLESAFLIHEGKLMLGNCCLDNSLETVLIMLIGYL